MKINKLLDISCVQAIHNVHEIDKMINIAVEYDVACVFTLPAFTDYTVKKIKKISKVKVGGVVGFPSGGETTHMKIMQAEELLKFGCDELDMVMNLTAFNSSMYDLVRRDIREVVKHADQIPVKVIIEAPSITEGQIKKAVNICIDSGAEFVKTGTGWQEKKTEIRHIELISKYAGDRIKIKAAGGIRDIETVRSMYDLGCSRFGVNIQTAEKLLNT